VDSIEKMRRMNELTKELKQRGFAESSFEAIQQANQIYGNEAMTSDVQHGIIQNSPHEKMTKDSTMEDANTINMEKKIGKLNDSLDVLTTKMNEIIKAINDMDTRINTLKTRPAERVVERVVEKPVNVSTQKEDKANTEAEAKSAAENHDTTSKSAEKPKDEYSMNQRVGNFQSQDVAIDKMFYFGKK
jgi:hypothetical protein